MLFTGAPSPAPGQSNIRLESRPASGVRTERLRAWSPNRVCKARSSEEYCQLSLCTDLKNGEGLLEDFEVGALVEEWL